MDEAVLRNFSLEVGKEYRLRNGLGPIKIISKEGAEAWPFLSEEARSFNADGFYGVDYKLGERNAFDIVATWDGSEVAPHINDKITAVTDSFVPKDIEPVEPKNNIRLSVPAVSFNRLTIVAAAYGGLVVMQSNVVLYACEDMGKATGFISIYLKAKD